MALSVNIDFNRGAKAEAVKTMKMLWGKQEKDGGFKGKIHSITCSTGQALGIETTSLAILAALKEDVKNNVGIEKAAQFLISQKSSFGGYGNTQSTVLALKALTQFAEFSKKTAEDGTIEIHLNNKKVAEAHYKAGEKDVIALNGLEKFVKAGKNKVKIVYVGVKNPLPFSVGVNYHSLQPASSPECKLALTTRFAENNAQMGQTARLNISLSNKTQEGLPMSMAVIGLPAGLSAQPWQLKELQEKGVFDFYEIVDNRLALYYRQMKPSESRQIALDLKTEMPGSYEAPASCAYLYYTNEHKHWVKAESVKVTK
jgi:hypothetical protein